MHRSLCLKIMALMRTGLMYPQLEPHSFPESRSQRVDISTNIGFGGKECLVDMAVTHALRFSALSRPGEAAAGYEAVKMREYGHLVESGRQLLVPCVVDTFGGWSPSAMNFLRVCARAFAARAGTGKMGEAVFFARLSTTLQRHIGGMLRGLEEASAGTLAVI